MIEVCHNLYVGSGEDYPPKGTRWHVVQAAKYPWFAETGASGMWTIVGNRLILNMVDANDIKYFPKAMIEKALSYIELHIDGKVLVHCNQGHSRGPSIALLYMGRKGLLPRRLNLAIKSFKKLYPPFAPGAGMMAYLKANYP